MRQGPGTEVRTRQVGGEDDDAQAKRLDASCNITVRKQWDYRRESVSVKSC